MFTLNRSDLEALSNSQPFLAEFPNAEFLNVSFTTEPDFVREVLPKPLRPTAEPEGRAFVAYYPESNILPGYHEAAVHLRARYKGEEGNYCLTMPADDDAAVYTGRERFGWPKKYAEQITLTRDRSTVAGRVVRKGSEILAMEAELGDTLPTEALAAAIPPVDGLDGQPSYKNVTFLFRWSLAPGGRRFDGFPRLVRVVTLMRPSGDIVSAKCRLTLSSSPADPLGDIPIRGIRSCSYGQWNLTALPAKVVGHARNMRSFMEHGWRREDSWAYMLDSAVLPTRTRDEQRRLRRQLQHY